MNGKLAKRLRRVAEERTKELPYKQYYKHERRGYIILGNDCTRGAYQRLKAAVKKEKRNADN